MRRRSWSERLDGKERGCDVGGGPEISRSFTSFTRHLSKHNMLECHWLQRHQYSLKHENCHWKESLAWLKTAIHAILCTLRK